MQQSEYMAMMLGDDGSIETVTWKASKDAGSARCAAFNHGVGNPP
jgi:hypothetical protein